MNAPLRVTDRSTPPASLYDAFESEGWEVVEGFDLPDAPWSLESRRWVRTGTVDDAPTMARCVMAAARGVGVVVGCADDGLRAELCDDLGRIGTVEVVLLGPDPLEALDDDQRSLLAALASGASIADAAAALFLSTRTAERRLASARRLLGVRTTAEAVAMAAT